MCCRYPDHLREVVPVEHAALAPVADPAQVPDPRGAGPRGSAQRPGRRPGLHGRAPSPPPAAPAARHDRRVSRAVRDGHVMR